MANTIKRIAKKIFDHINLNTLGSIASLIGLYFVFDDEFRTNLQNFIDGLLKNPLFPAVICLLLLVIFIVRGLNQPTTRSSQSNKQINCWLLVRDNIRLRRQIQKLNRIVQELEIKNQYLDDDLDTTTTRYENKVTNLRNKLLVFEEPREADKASIVNHIVNHQFLTLNAIKEYAENTLEITPREFSDLLGELVRDGKIKRLPGRGGGSFYYDEFYNIL